MPISNTGFWIDVNFEEEHAYDPSLAEGLYQFFKEQNVQKMYDFGCGPGEYVKKMRSCGIDSMGYDGNPVTSSIPNCEVADLTSNFQLNPVECVMCLEVGEHVPKEFETALLDTIDRHVLPGGVLVLSWAVPGQGGLGHVNCQTNEYVRTLMTKRGYSSNSAVEDSLRKRATLQWFRNTILVFQKQPLLHGNQTGGLGNQLFTIANLSAKGRPFCMCNHRLEANPHSDIDYSTNILSKFQYSCKGSSETVDTTPQNYAHIAQVLPTVVSNLTFSNTIPKLDAAFLHIRGGDYVGNKFHDVLLESYYTRAVRHFPSDTLFYIFTNDVEYAKKHAVLQNIQCKFAECSDECMALEWMKQCTRGGICANSSFSWWAAVLDMNRTLVIPSRWSTDVTWNSSSDYRFPNAIVEEVPIDVYCIHLAHRDDRMNHIEQLRKRYPSIQFHIVDAIHDTNGVRGCVLSHKKAVELAKTKKLPYLFVIEDDCDFLMSEADLLRAVSCVLHYLPNVDVVSGCGNLVEMTAQKVAKVQDISFLKSPDIRTTHCIFYGESSYDSILGLSEETAIDIQLNGIHTLYTYPYLASQLPSFSDIANTHTEYDNIEKSRAFVQTMLDTPRTSEVGHKVVNPMSVLRVPVRTNRM
jgi:hypothetical protein